MSASPPPSNPLDEIKGGLKESPPHEEFKAGIADKQPLLQNNQPRYAFGWFDKWLLIIPVILLLLLCYLGWTALNPAPIAPNASASPTTAAAFTAPTTSTGSTVPTTSGASNAPNAVTQLSLNAPSGGTTVAVGETVTLSGQAPPGSAVQLLNRGTPISTTTADANGNYEFKLSAAQPGTYELSTVTTIDGKQVTSPPIIITVQGSSANATNAASGNTSGANATSIAGSNQNATPIAGATSDVNAGGANATPVAGATSDANAGGGANATPVAGATAEANAAGGANPTTVAGATSDANAGSANATTVAGATSDANASGANATTAEPQVISLKTASSPVTVAVGQPIQLTGIAPPGATVRLLNHGSPIATTTADANGAYQFDLTPETAGEYELQAVTTVNGQQVTSPTVTIVVSEAGAGVTPNAAGTPGAGESATSTANEAGTPSAETTPGASNGGTSNSANNTNAIPPSMNLPANGILIAGAVLNGSAPPYSHVVIYFNDKEVGSADADANGAWQFTVPNTLTPGDYTVRVAVTDANGKPIGDASETQSIRVMPKLLLPVTGGEFPQ